MLRWDGALTAKLLAATLRDPRVRHFHDPNRRAGRAVAESLGGYGKIAWDIYLFYAPGGEWSDTLPVPATWAHQLSDSGWADPARDHRGDDLAWQLHAAMMSLSRAGKMSEQP